MRIVQMLPNLHLGGVERGVVELSRALISAGLESVVISGDGALRETIIADGARHIPFDCASKNLFTLPARALRLRTLWRRLCPDIVHMRSRIPAWLVRYSRSAGHFSVVSTFHGLYSVNRYSAQMAAADMVICPSRAVVEYVRRHYGTAEDKLHLIHRGADRDYFDPQKVDDDFCAAFRRRYQLENATVVAIVGRVSARKGHALFLQAFAKTLSAFAEKRAASSRSLVGLIVGDSDGKKERELQLLAARLGIADSLRWVGVQRQMREIYHLADVVVSPSLKPEAFGRTMVEALNMERPVVAAAHGGALDIVRAGENGILFPPGDTTALAAGLEKALITKWGSLRQTVADFSLARMAAETLAVYRRVYHLAQNTRRQL